MPYEMNAHDRRELIAAKADLLSSCARHGSSRGELNREDALEIIAALSGIADELPPRPPKAADLSSLSDQEFADLYAKHKANVVSALGGLGFGIKSAA